MSDTNNTTNTATTTKRGRPRKYHTPEEYAEAKKRYYATKKAKIQQQAQHRRDINARKCELNAQKCELQKDLERTLEINAFPEYIIEQVWDVLQDAVLLREHIREELEEEPSTPRRGPDGHYNIFHTDRELTDEEITSLDDSHQSYPSFSLEAQYSSRSSTTK